MSRRLVWAVATGLGLLLLLAILLWPRADKGFPPPEGTEPAAAAASEELTTVEPVERILYFPGEGGRLYGEPRMLSPEGALEEQAERLVSNLLAGPRNTSLRAPLPESIRLRRAYLLSSDTLALDLESPENSQPPAVGSQREMLIVYSLVDTLIYNLEGIERVALLWNGRQRKTLGGHLDTSRPLSVNTTLVAEGVQPPPLAPEPKTTDVAGGSESP